ncbi:MAG TPA: glycosyltransferase family 2 protein [Steroidobacteraceae bacterium]|jgi:glycosyltransferase involved in cell wall biosynthesis|nr:glycosyltransferase family 2 protein [Steroidobacteraceae bacterium]
MALDLSVVVPLFNEEESLRPLYAAIVAGVEPLGVSFEIVFVDDGSRDDTVRVADEIARADPRVCLVKFRRNYGQTPAMAAGIAEARGEIIVTMDGDLQNDPADIGKLLARIEEGNDIVVGWRHERQDKLWTRKVPSRIANALIAKVTGVPIRDNGCSLKAYRACLIKRIPLYSEMHRFIPAMASIAGPRIAEIRVRHHARRFGQSKYGLSRIYKVLLDLMVIKTVASFTARPMLWYGLLSLPMLGAAALALGWTCFTLATEGRMSLSIAGTGVIFLTSTIMLLAAGALGELIYKLGDLREHQFSGLTQHLLVRGAASHD